MKKRNFAALAILVAMSALYSQTENNWFNSWISQILGMDQIYVSYMVSLSSIFGAVFFLIWGTYSDTLRTRWGRRKPVLVPGLIVTGLLVIAFGMTKNYWMCLILDGLILMIFANMCWAARPSLVADLEPEARKRGKLNSNLVLMGAIGVLIAYLFVFFGEKDINNNYTEFTHQLVFIVTGIGAVAGAIIIWFALHEPDMKELPPATIPWYRALRNIFKLEEMKQNKGFYRLFLASLFLFTAKNSYLPYILIFVQKMGYSTLQTLYYSIAMGAGTFLGPFLLPRLSDKLGRKKVTMAVIPFGLVGLVLMACSVFSFPLFIIGAILVFFILEGVGQVQETWSQDMLDPAARGKFLGIINITISLSKMPGGIIGALFADAFGIWTIYLVGAAFLLAAIPMYHRVPDLLTAKSASLLKTIETDSENPINKRRN